MPQEVSTSPRRPVWQVRRQQPPAELPSMLATVWVALTVGLLAASFAVSAIPILLMYVLWLPMLLTGWRPLLRGLRRNRLTVLYAALCVASVIWSSYRAVSLRAALETASMILCVLIIAQRTSLPCFIKGLNLGATGVLIGVLASGTYGVDYFTGTYSLTGWLGSKNQVGLFAELAVYGGLLHVFARNSLHSKIVYAALPLLVGLYCLYASRSAASTASLAILLAITGAAWLWTKMPRRQRAAAATVGIMLALLLLAAGAVSGWHQEILGLLGKNATLTGRTYLWGEGLKVGLEHPLLGHGYAAFWVPGQLQAERYWYEFGIVTRTGFHFHNMFVQSFVDLGAVGVLLFAALYATTCVLSFRALARYGVGLTVFFAIGMAVLFLIRAMVEVDLLPSFGMGPLLFFSVVPRLNRLEAAQSDS